MAHIILTFPKSVLSSRCFPNLQLWCQHLLGMLTYLPSPPVFFLLLVYRLTIMSAYYNFWCPLRRPAQGGFPPGWFWSPQGHEEAWAVRHSGICWWEMNCGRKNQRRRGDISWNNGFPVWRKEAHVHKHEEKTISMSLVSLLPASGQDSGFRRWGSESWFYIP